MKHNTFTWTFQKNLKQHLILQKGDYQEGKINILMGLIKDELARKIIIEFATLRPKVSTGSFSENHNEFKEKNYKQTNKQ